MQFPHCTKPFRTVPLSLTRQPQYLCTNPCHNLFKASPFRKRPTVRIQAQPENKPEGLSVKTVTSVLWEAQSAWGSYARQSGGGELTLQEAVEILNGPELRKVALTLFNVEPAQHTPEDLAAKFKQADADGSGRLSRTEFLALYLSVVTGRVKTSPGVLAEAFLGFIDADRNGRIEGGELKVLLTLLGFPMAMFLPIPKAVGVDYRSWLSRLNGGAGDKQ